MVCGFSRLNLLGSRSLSCFESVPKSQVQVGAIKRRTHAVSQATCFRACSYAMQTCSTRAGACTCQHVGPGTYRRAGCADLSTLCKHGSRCVGEQLNSCGMARDQRVWEWNACGQWAFCVRFRRVLKHSPAAWAEHA